MIKALGISQAAFEAADYEIEVLLDRLRTDDYFVRAYKFESLRETLTLDYPSYILALAMGAGKTILIATIIATEFAMAMEYPDGPFVQNALVFAPGKTIIESLRELSQVPYEKILPPRLHKAFAANLKLTFTRDGDPNIPVIRGSSFNVVVTNTEKIRIQKETIRKRDLDQLMLPSEELEKARAEVANRRLQAIASLPHLAVFSDEAHHTYGQTMGKDLKRVRQTVDYLNDNSPNLICVVNTTGTPYFQRQPLRDVVIWYGLSEGIHEGILKEVAGNIYAYDFDPSNAMDFVREVISDFFRTYKDVGLPDGSPAKLAMYFPQNDDLDELRPHVENTLASIGQSPAVILRNTSESTQEEVNNFNRLNDPESPYRVILLVNKGTEGWNCPSLFSCALARKLKSSNNFVLQAASRCLRQIPGNNHPARIYLSMENRSVLDKQLKETYGETIADLDRTGRETRSAILKLKKVNIPPLVVSQLVRTVVPFEDTGHDPLRLEKPKGRKPKHFRLSIFTVMEQQSTDRILQQLGEEVELEGVEDSVDLYTAAVRFSDAYRIDPWVVYDELERLYGSKGDIPLHHIDHLAMQIEEQTRKYDVKEERVDVALALVKPEGFVKITEPDGSEVYTAEIRYPKDREQLLLSLGDMKGNEKRFGFHYTPYNFDSNPEKSFFEQLLHQLNTNPSEVEDIYFTGAVTDPNKTDFFVEYKDEKGKWRNYTPDFVIRKKGKRSKPGKCLIVEIKAERERAHPLDGEGGRKAIAMKRWVDLNPEHLQYEMIFTPSDAISVNQTLKVRDFVEEKD
ncbi:MAG: DEAD/DEAH box helicase family protein [Desulfobacterales bacterium]|nr:DEAD/DEAH box helicase family protein [Desulfobacterales bacterium]